MGPILECGAACWDPHREGQINSLDRVQKKATKFANNRAIRSGKLWRSVGRYLAFAPPSKRTPEKGLGKL